MVVLNGGGIFLMEETGPIRGPCRQKLGLGTHKINGALLSVREPGASFVAAASLN